MDQGTQTADQIAQRLEALKGRLGDKKAELSGEIDQIVASVKQLSQSGQSQDNPRSR